MPTEVKDAKPRRMHGITATPFEMPAGILPEQKQRESGRPWLISLFAIVYFVHAGVSLLLALVPWSDPESGLATFLIAHPSFVFSLFPRMIQPTLAEVGSIRNNVLQGLPVIFLILGVIYIPFFNPIFNTIPLGWRQWEILLPLLLIPSVVAELVKWFYQRLQK